MAIDQGSTNTTRYHTVPDSADFDLPNGDWTWLSLCYPTENTNVKYIISTGAWGGANAFNLFTYGSDSALGFSCRVASLGEDNIVFKTVGDQWFLAYATRRSGTLYAGAVDLAGLTSRESAGASISSAYSNPNDVNIGRRQDGTTTRYWNGRWTYAAFIDGHGLTGAEAIEVASGSPLLSMPFAPNIADIFHGRTADDSSFGGIIKGHVATRNGTSYGTSEEDILTPYTGSIIMPFSVAAAAGGGNPYYIYDQMRRH